MEEIIGKYLSGDATDAEKATVENWRNASEENSKSFFEFKTLWSQTAIIEKDRSDLLHRILDHESDNDSKQFFIGWWKYAVAAAIVVALGLVTYLQLNKGEKLIHELADGTIIQLHRGAKINSIKYTENKRVIDINGKAYFNVERDENRPFVVNSKNSQVKVLGTSFIVDFTEFKSEVSVESGLVEFIKKSPDSNVAVKLEKGEMGLIDADNRGIIKKLNNNPNYLAWKTKKIIFEDSEMSEVKEILEDVYGINISIDNPSFQKCKLTAKLYKKKAKDAIEIIARTFDVDYDFNGKSVTFRGKGC